MGRGSSHRAVVVALAAGVLALASGVDAAAQLLPFGPQQGGEPAPTSQTSTTTETSTTTTTAAPPITLLPRPFAPPAPEPAPAAPSDPAPATPVPSPPTDPADPGDGEGGTAPPAGRAVPPSAQAVINSIVRTPPGNSQALVDGAALLEAAGVAHDEAMRAVFGRFPIHGPSHWSDDWYYPRWTGTTFRFHEGLDMFAPYGTPVAAPVDGIARISHNALGGLSVRVVEPDATYWYLAHLSGIAEGLVDGQPVTTGQVVGFVGDSGNAKGTSPHLHFAVYPQGGGAAAPKPVVDQWVADGAARVPELLAHAEAARTAKSQPAAATTSPARRVAGAEIGPPALLSPSRSELLWASAANPAGGALHVADAAAAAAVGRIDWARRAAEQRALDLAWAGSVDRARRLLAPLTAPALRQAVEALRAR